jgi:hypothetical protein
MKKSDLVHRIHEVFSTQTPPAATQIVDSGCDEAAGIRLMLSGKLWTELAHNELCGENSALGFLTDQAFRYYLPAYMILLLHDLRAADLLSSSVIRHLTLPVEGDTLLLMNSLGQSRYANKNLETLLQDTLRESTTRAGKFILRMKGFTQPQGETINEFLRFLTEHHSDYYDEREPEIARLRYWLQFGA